VVPESGEGPDGFAGPLFSQAQLIEHLQIQPEFGARAEKVRQAQGRVPGNGALPIDNFGYAIRGHPEPTGQRRRAHIEGCEFFSQVFSGVNRDLCH